MLKKKLYYFFYLLSIILLFSIHTSAKIIVSIKPLGFIASSIVHDLVPIDVLLPSNNSEHDYLLKPSDLKKIKNTDLLIWIDPEIEHFLIKTASLLPKNRNLLLSSEKEISSLIISKKNKKNMHLWLSPKIAKKFAFLIYKRLSLIMPSQKKYFYLNLKNFEIELSKIDKKIFNQLKYINNKKYFVFHDAFTYFEKYYKLPEPIVIFTNNPLINPGIKTLQEINYHIKQNKKICIFTEPQYQSKFIKNISGDFIKKGILDPLGSHINIEKNSYINFLLYLSNQYFECLQ